MARPRQASLKSAVVAAACGCVLVLLAGGGCELAISDAVPAFYCAANTPGACPDGEVCSGNQCVPKCTQTSCRTGMTCSMVSPTAGLCIDASVVPPDDGSAPDSAEAGEETSVVDSNNPMDTSVGPDTVVPPPPDSSDSACTGSLCSCAGDSYCASGVCAGVLDVGAGLYAAAGKIDFCTTPCCSSADCEAGLVCYATSTSASEGNYCVRPQWLMRSTTLGLSIGGKTCTANSDCRSGLCDTTSGTCADTCCSTKQSGTECATGMSCGFGNFPGVATFDTNFTPLCGSFGTTPNGSTCQGSSECQSGLCAGSGFNGTCQDPCRSSSDCAGQNFSCSIDHLQYQGGSGVYGLCFPYQGGNADGTACQSDADCQSNFCNGSMICSNICFANTDCPAGLHCRPEYVMMLSRGGGAASVLSCGM